MFFMEDKSDIGAIRRELYKSWSKRQSDVLSGKEKPSIWRSLGDGAYEFGMDVLADPSSNDLDPDATRERLLQKAQENKLKGLPPGDAWMRLLNQGKLPSDF